MYQDEYLDLLKRFMALAETLLDTLALAGALGAMLVTKGVCTQEEIEEAKRLTYESESMKIAIDGLTKRKAEIEELENADPYGMIMDLIAKKKGE